MGQPTGEVDTVALARVGASVQQSSDKVDKAHSAHIGQLTPAGALPGWGTGDVLATAVHAWSGFLRNLAAQIDAHGAALRASAQQYEATDRAAAGRLGPPK
ncbi:type VII secretion target [Actinoplanes sp. NPDC049548]|uniref:type VII secretion target n=1 Tax=Actinoplanes sp. NPDC049548 TaxID=3155152 RepID=UPI00342457E2